MGSKSEGNSSPHPLLSLSRSFRGRRRKPVSRTSLDGVTREPGSRWIQFSLRLRLAEALVSFHCGVTSCERVPWFGSSPRHPRPINHAMQTPAPEVARTHHGIRGRRRVLLCASASCGPRTLRAALSGSWPDTPAPALRCSVAQRWSTRHRWMRALAALVRYRLGSRRRRGL